MFCKFINIYYFFGIRLFQIWKRENIQDKVKWSKNLNVRTYFGYKNSSIINLYTNSCYIIAQYVYA